jgi:diacylglycerol kinase (ATP)
MYDCNNITIKGRYFVKHVFIVNPVSGKTDARTTLLPKISAEAERLGLDYEVRCTEYKGHAIKMAQEYGEVREPARLYAIGGDGTINELITGAHTYKCLEVASVPCGSGNDFVRSFGSVEDFLDIPDLIAGTAITIDLIKTNRGIAASICSMGMDAAIAYGIPKFRRIPFCGGTMAYQLSIIQTICGRMGYDMRVTLDDKITLTDRYLIATVCNGVAYGGGYRASPNADLQDGMLEVIVVKRMSRLRCMDVLNNYYKHGKHLVNDKVSPKISDVMSYYKAKKITMTALDTHTPIVNVDGECGPAREFTAEVMPSAARFVLPKKLFDAFEGEKEQFIRV